MKLLSTLASLIRKNNIREKLKKLYTSALFRKIVLYFAGALALLLILFFLFRNTILHSVIENKCRAFKEKYQAEIIVRHATFKGFTGITLEDISVVPAQRDVLFRSGRIYAHVRPLPLLAGKVRINEVLLENTMINLIRHGKQNNYGFLFKPQKDSTVKHTDSTYNYAARLDRIFSGIFSNVPDDIEIRNFLVHAASDTNSVTAFLPSFHIENYRFLSVVTTSEKHKRQLFFVRGEIYKSRKLLNFMVYAPQRQKVHVPYIRSKYGFRCDFDTLYAGIAVEGNSSALRINGENLITGLVLNHKKIALSDVFFKKIALKLNIRASRDFVELDSNSLIAYNRFALNPYIKACHKPVVKIRLKINHEFTAQNLFESLPGGMFGNFAGIKTKGKLRLSVNFDLDMHQPDSLRFDATLTGKDFQIIKYGATDFRMINGSFSHTAYVNGLPVRSFIVGPDNPAYTPLEMISPYLKDAVLISENGGFFYGDGFNVAAFRESIIANIHAGHFVRGGSTIDMQLVKNVFLNKNKTIARKAEEILISWLINNNHLCTKEKMYEVYLNLIEWGPGVYGVSEASDYYFQKKPSQLSLSESIFLASIIPKPRWFKSSFDETGKFSPRYQPYFSLIAKKMIDKGSATAQDTLDMIKKIEIKGNSKIFMAKDTTHFKIDSVMME
ncbi:MAG TPA: transglycosylase domain-containing protein [Bacteroidales bacterium]|nr:transglycosylase domain-containing protein [Bacteroidales bacterium]